MEELYEGLHDKVRSYPTGRPRNSSAAAGCCSQLEPTAISSRGDIFEKAFSRKLREPYFFCSESFSVTNLTPCKTIVSGILPHWHAALAVASGANHGPKPQKVRESKPWEPWALNSEGR